MTAAGGGEQALGFYFRPGCHLCDEMWQQLQMLQARHGFGLIAVDVDQDPALRARYGHLVPVLAAGDTVICHYFLDQDALARYLAS